MTEKIAFFVFDNLYSSKKVFTQKLAEAFDHLGHETKIFLIADGKLTKEHISSLYRFAPTFSCSFNTMLPMEDGNYLWDVFETPHISFLLDPAIYYLNLTKGLYSILTYVDRSDGELLETSGFTTSFFLPHGIERKWAEAEWENEKLYDVVLMGSCYDHETVKTTWEEKYSKEVCEVIEEVIAKTLAEPLTPFINALVDVWNKKKLDPTLADFQDLSTCIDYYLRGYDRYQLIRSIKDVKIDVFGEVFWETGKKFHDWNYYVGDLPNVTVHDGVDFEKSHEILKRSRLCLNSTPFFKHGSHERFLTGLSFGCSVLTSENSFPRQVFGSESGIYYYQFNKWNEINDQVLDILVDEKKRENFVRRGKEIVINNHTWDHRAQEILNQIPAMLGQIYARTANPN